MNIGRSEYARLKKAALDLEVLKDAVRHGLASWQCRCLAENSEMFKRLSRLVEEKEQEPDPEDEAAWTCGICGRRRKDVEPVQDFEVGDACPEHYEEVPAHE